MPTLYAVIMAGGSGTRFWPASTRERPKQLLPLGSTNDPLIASTVERVEPWCSPDRILIATGAHLLDSTREALPKLPPESFLGEPVARNTAACIGWANSVIRRRDPDAVVMVLPSDHHIGDLDAYRGSIDLAVESAAAGRITTVGITPTRPETGYGYIQVGEEQRPGVFRVERFVEKPDTLRAKEYLASKKYLWNSGMFFFLASTMQDAIAEHMPSLAEGLSRIEEASDDAAVTREVFHGLASISIDYGVMEKASPIDVVPGDFGWSDVGSWQTAWELAPKDDHGNDAPNSAVLIDARGNLVRDLRSEASGKTIAMVGVEDLCVIETDDALLVVPRERCQDVRRLVEELRDRGVLK